MATFRSFEEQSTTFLLSGASEEAMNESSPRRSRQPNEAPLVFLAEDDADLRRLLGAAFRSAGFDVLSAATGHEMLHLLRSATCNASDGTRRAPDAIVMDVRMPRCSGLDILSALRLAEWSQPVVMITAFGDPETHARAADYGAAVVLDKPFDSDDLVAVVDILVRLNHAELMKRGYLARSPEWV